MRCKQRQEKVGRHFHYCVKSNTPAVLYSQTDKTYCQGAKAVVCKTKEIIQSIHIKFRNNKLVIR